jgi:hypothetical protein
LVIGEKKKDGISNIEQGILNVEGMKGRRVEGEKLEASIRASRCSVRFLTQETLVSKGF